MKYRAYNRRGSRPAARLGGHRPRPRRRVQALAKEGRATVTVALGLIVVLGVSGVIEVFVTPSPLPSFVRIGI